VRVYEFEDDPQRFEREGRCKGTPCRLCGRKVREPYRYCIHEVGGGGFALREEDEKYYANDPGDLGEQPVGSECRKIFPPGYVREVK
jgi:hypothetical protein